MSKRVLSVGQCGADHGSIRRTLAQAFGTEVVSADSIAEALDALHHDTFALVLVNRVFDADGTSGLDLVRAIKSDSDLTAVPVMLVSNYEDAQTQAVAVGAISGFGKASLGRAAMLASVAPFLGASS
jgi:two-component system, chemotaxis family, chemotaxis protein CheY